MFAENDPNFDATQLTHEEAQWWLGARQRLRDQRKDQGLVATLAAIGTGLQFLPVIGNLVGGSLIGISTLVAGTGNAVAGGVTALAGGAPGAGGALATAGQVGSNLGVPGAKAITLGAKSSVPGQSAAQQRANQAEGIGLAATVAVPVAGAAGGVAASEATSALAQGASLGFSASAQKKG